ncbi:creatininase family protein [Oceanibacterium hippocampi]|uniref:Creatinine amidohydrolase n=1 Tax=Oceanibacterium hippocampi TaxID=745714 RepID=A0A1Y5REP3_9PROT|nr:creatininase family protein [Oceanibacterium hippocampi]SLN15377.1 Creatinine amidohydrolase [Oceanibacterium hippocampi]
MLLKLMTWQEVEGYLGQSRGIIVPIGSTEQHGPNGLIGTDAICPEAIAARAGELGNALVAPTIPIGVAQHHMAFPGTIAWRPTTLIRVVVDTVESLARHGFERIYFLNGHGGNIATVQAAFSEVYGERSLAPADNRPPLRCILRNWWEGDSVARMRKQMFGHAEGMHATASEVAVTQHVYPDAIKQVAMSPTIAPVGRFTDAEDYRRTFPDGRIGSDPTLASPEKGAELLEASARDVADDYAKFIAA